MKSSILLLSVLVFTASCGIGKVMDSANSIPPKLDDTNGKMTGMNNTMVGMDKNMNGMNSTMGDMKKGIDSTNESVRLQKLILAKNDMLDDKNTRDLEPVALGMVAGAKKFGEAATTEELIEYTRVLLLKIKDQKPDDSLKVNGKFPASVIADYDHRKMVDLNQIFTIAGFCPQEKVDQIINDEIYAGGLYQRTAYAFLMARVLFTGTYLQETLLAEPMDTVKIMKETVTRLGAIDSILKLPFKSKIALNVAGFIGQDAIEISLYDATGAMDDSWNAPKLWNKVLKRFDQDLKDGNIVQGSSSKSSAVAEEIATLKATVQTYIDSWK